MSAQYAAFLLDTLGAVRPITAKRMFGGVGYYADGWFFAIADDDQLYFDDAEELARWMARALAVARAAAARPGGGRARAAPR